MEDEQKRLISAIQTVIVIAVAIPFGVIPLVRWVFGAGQGGLSDLVIGELSGNAEWVVPLIVLAVALFVVIAVEELPKRKQQGQQDR